jgi:hypothetical protein
MPGSTCLKAWMADCWKTVWNDDPLPLSVPDRLVLLDAGAPLLVGDVLLLDDELEEHAARATAPRTSPALTTGCLPRKCISGTPYTVYRVSGRNEQPGQPANCQTAVCEYKFVGVAGTCG